MTVGPDAPQGTIVITGASRGLGAALAREFAKHGHDLLLVARTEAALQDLALELGAAFGVTARVFACDLARSDAAQRLFDHCQANAIDVGGIINNAAEISSEALSVQGAESVRRLIAINVGAPSEITALFLPSLLRRPRADIINISSLAGLQPLPNHAVYSATKAYLAAFSDAVREELKGTGVRCYTVLLGPLRTRMLVADNARPSALAFASRLSSDPETAAEVIYEACLVGRPRFSAGTLGATIAFGLAFLPRRLSMVLARQLS